MQAAMRASQQPWQWHSLPAARSASAGTLNGCCQVHCQLRWRAHVPKLSWKRCSPLL